MLSGWRLYAQVIPLSPLEPATSALQHMQMSVDSGNEMHSSHQYYTRENILQFLSRHPKVLKTQNRYDVQYLLDELDESDGLLDKYNFNSAGVPDTIFEDSTHHFYSLSTPVISTPSFTKNKKPLFGFLYKTPGSMLSIDVPDFYLRLDPVIHFRYGKSAGVVDQNVFSNIRGFEMRGGISDRVFFSGSLHESQEGYPAYVNNYISAHKAVPGAGFYKPYSSSVINLQGYDFLNAHGLIGFHILKPITLQFGHGRNFIGDGIRSLFLSDFGANYLYLKLNTKLWIFDYQNLWCQLQYSGRIDNDHEIPKKYMAAHHLSLNIFKWLNVGLFESIVFSRTNHFEFQYLNPIIFYRAIEQLVGSPDNANVGIDFKVRAGSSVQLYGQWLIDELIINNLIKNNGWWGNKNGLQLGLKYINVGGIDHLDLQLELNRVRPYTYTHTDLNANYTHYNQPLAHPLEANFTEVLARVRWMPINNLFVEPRLMYALKGEDDPALESTYGGNIFIPNTRRIQDFDNTMLQGIKSTRIIAGLDISYMWYHNMFVDLSFSQRRFTAEGVEIPSLKENIFTLGLRINAARRTLDF